MLTFRRTELAIVCGIAGEIRRTGAASPEVVEKQLRLLDHRGPDSWGVFASRRGAIGQTRLAIIDLITGDPPISTPDGRIGVALNGEIYNYRELRRVLSTSGHRLRTSGDTEVIVHLAEQLEPVELARRLEGMFALAVWDDTRERLILARDRFGKKPLYWWMGPDRFVFASEIKAVLKHPAVTPTLDADAIPAYLNLGYVPTPRTFFAGIHSVQPGHALVVGADLQPTLEEYWRPRAATKGKGDQLDADLSESARLVDASLEVAVRDRLVSDVPLGAFLSGGLDSSLVVAYMARAAPDRVRTFTIGFDEATGYDERAWASAVATHLGTDHTEFVVAPPAVDLVEKLVWHHDQPFADSSAIPTFLLSELAAHEVRVALAGDGGDELFGGYERFSAGLISRRLGPLASWTRLLGRLVKPPGRGAKLRRFLASASLSPPDALRAWTAYMPEELVVELSGAAPALASDSYRYRWRESEGADQLDRLLVLTMQTYLLDDLLPKVDRMSMAHGLEVRSPFLDHRLAELALHLPPNTKATVFSRKRVLRALGRDLLPREILNRPKKGFGVPLAQWFRRQLSGYVTAALGSDARVRHHLRGGVIDQLLIEHASGPQDHSDALWALLTLEVFLRSHDW